jgi:hypothetical protein
MGLMFNIKPFQNEFTLPGRIRKFEFENLGN